MMLVADPCSTSVADAPQGPRHLDDAIAHAVYLIDGMDVVFVHPQRDAFVILGRRLFATVEPASGDARPLYEVRLARYGRGAGPWLARRLEAQGYVEMGWDLAVLLK